jgi:haloalkane dehalogenase
MKDIPDHLYPFTSHWHQTRGLKMHYLDEGPRDAPPVLMLHGNPTWSIYYRNLIPILSDKYRCIAPDHIGCGLSDKPGDEKYDYRMSSRIEDIESLVASLELNQPVTLVVHDWGGMIGMAWACRHPELIAQLVISNTAAFPLPTSKRMPASLSLARNTRLGALLVRGGNAFAQGAIRLATAKGIEKTVRKAYTAPYDSWQNRIATLRFVQDIPLGPDDPGFDILLDTAEHLHLFRDFPCLIAWGDKDFVFDFHFLNEWQKYLPKAEVVRYPDCGHYLLEDAGPELTARIRAFIDTRDESNHGQTFN